MHGHKFQIIYSQKGEYTPEMNKLIRNVNNPCVRDTITVPGNGFTVIRFRADNPGIWMFHCHIEFHLQAGLAMIFVEAPDLIQSQIKVPQNFIDQCQNMKTKIKGNAAGYDDISTFDGIPKNLELYPDYIQLKGYISLAGCILSAGIGLFTVIWFASFENKL